MGFGGMISASRLGGCFADCSLWCLLSLLLVAIGWLLIVLCTLLLGLVLVLFVLMMLGLVFACIYCLWLTVFDLVCGFDVCCFN